MVPHTMTPRYLDVSAAAAYLGITETALRTRVHRGTMPFIREHGRLRFDTKDLDRLMEAHRMSRRPKTENAKWHNRNVND